MSRRALAGGLALLLAAGCSKPQDVAEPPATDVAALNQQIAGDMAAVRLKAAEARIEQLERQVGEMQARPEKLDLQLLTQRLEAVEARVYAKGTAEEAAPAPRTPPRRADPAPTASPTSRFNPFGL